jgi:hypothetical protein
MVRYRLCFKTILNCTICPLSLCLFLVRDDPMLRGRVRAAPWRGQLFVSERVNGWCGGRRAGSVQARNALSRTEKMSLPTRCFRQWECLRALERSTRIGGYKSSSGTSLSAV